MRIPQTPPKTLGKRAAERATLRLEAELNRLLDPGRKKLLKELIRRDEAKLKCIFACSPFLRAAVIADLEFLAGLGKTPLAKITAAICRRLERQFSSQAELMRVLRLSRRSLALAVAWRDLEGAELTETTAALSAFADKTVAVAVKFLLEANRSALGIPAARVTDCGYAVFAVGKLGARELNYSSDIDLLAFYDYRRNIAPPRAAEIFPAVTRELLNVLSARTAEGYVFRTDLRLRPDPSSTPPSLSLEAAELYYQTVGQNWERAALIKARFIAGDRNTGEAFLQMIKPFVWRRNLDFAALDDILSIRRQSVSTEGKKRKTDGVGLNIKLAGGGIRDIEFFVQTRQLIWGGKIPSLRAAATLEILPKLIKAEQVDKTSAGILADNYRFLRHVEHRMQMVADSQTHQVPTAEDAKNNLAAFCGFASFRQFAAELLRTLESTKKILDGIYRPQKPLGGGGSLSFTDTRPTPQTLATLAEMGFEDCETAWKTVAGWHFGRSAAVRNERARQLLTELTPALLKSFAATASPDRALEGFNGFLLGLPTGVQVFSLLAANLNLMELLAQLMDAAPRQAIRLTKNPALLESLLRGDLYRPPGRYETLKKELEETLSLRGIEPQVAIRRWAKDHKFKLAVQLLTNQIDAWRATPHYTHIAELSLRLEHRIISREFAAAYGEIDGELAIVGLGKLGAGRLTGASDLDLVFIHTDGETVSKGKNGLAAQNYFNRLAQRIIGGITAKSAEGELYTLDMRLRPAEGARALSLGGFCRYQRSTAEFWEKMALCKARVIVASPPFKRRLETALAEILDEPEDADFLRGEIKTLQKRIGDNYDRDDPWQLKYMSGGLLDLDLLIQFFCRTEPLRATDPIAALNLIGKAELLKKAEVFAIGETYKLWCRLDGLKRLCLTDSTDPKAFGASLRRKLAVAAEAKNFAALTAEMAAARKRVTAIFRRRIG